MGLFRRKLNNTAAGALPPIAPGPTTIHNHVPNPLWESISKVIAIFLAAAGTWAALWFIFWQMGSYRPGQSAASLVLYGTLIPVGLWFLNWLLGPYFDSRQSFKLEIEREITRREEIRLLGAQTALEPGRYTEDDYLFARVVVSVMEVAYDWLEKEQRDKFPARWRPWSKTSVLDTAEKIGVTITQDKALSVAKWLADEGIITAADMGQIARSYPNLSSVRAHLDNKYGRPIVSVSPTLRSNAGYVHIKN